MKAKNNNIKESNIVKIIEDLGTRIAITTDSHFVEEHFTEQLKFYKEQFFPYCKEEGIKNWFELGDMTDKRTHISGLLMHRMLNEFLPLLKEFDITPWFLLGNHQMFYKEKRDVHNLEVFKHLGYNVIDEPAILVSGTHRIFLQPWLVPKEEFVIPKGDITLVLGHFEMNEAYVTRTYQSNHGLDVKLFDDVVCYSGHFHIRQNMYLGNPYQQNWNDFGERKGFHIIDLEAPDFPDFVENRSSRKHIKMQIESDIGTEGISIRVYDGIDLDDTYKLTPKMDMKKLVDTLHDQKLKIIIHSNVKINVAIKSFLTKIELDVKPFKMQVSVLLADTETDESSDSKEDKELMNKSVSSLLVSLYDGKDVALLEDIVQEAIDTSNNGEG